MQLLQGFSSSRRLKVVPFVPRSLRTTISERVARYRSEGCNSQMRTSPRVD